AAATRRARRVPPSPRRGNAPSPSVPSPSRRRGNGGWSRGEAPRPPGTPGPVPGPHDGVSPPEKPWLSRLDRIGRGEVSDGYPPRMVQRGSVPGSPSGHQVGREANRPICPTSCLLAGRMTSKSAYKITRKLSVYPSFVLSIRPPVWFAVTASSLPTRLPVARPACRQSDWPPGHHAFRLSRRPHLRLVRWLKA